MTNTKLDAYKAAFDFTYSTLASPSTKEVHAKALDAFTRAGFNDSEWEWWFTTVMQMRGQMQAMSVQKLPAASPATLVAETPKEKV